MPTVEEICRLTARDFPQCDCSVAAAADRDLIGVCRLIEIGRSLVVGDVTIDSEGDEHPLAHAVGTYSIPPRST